MTLSRKRPRVTDATEGGGEGRRARRRYIDWCDAVTHQWDVLAEINERPDVREKG